MSSANRAPIRRAARAIIVDAAGRVLLFRGEVSGRQPWWFAPGGALDRGETYEAAMVREVMEETGLVITTRLSRLRSGRAPETAVVVGE